MSKFKVGDRVVRIGVQSGKHFPNDRGVILEFKKFNRVLVSWDRGVVTGNDTKHIVLEIIYNSPLYQALL